MRMSSSYTNWQHRTLGSSNRLICCLVMTSKAEVATNSDGVEPYKQQDEQPERSYEGIEPTDEL